MRPTFHLSPAEHWAAADPNLPYEAASTIARSAVSSSAAGRGISPTPLAVTCSPAVRSTGRGYLAL